MGNCVKPSETDTRQAKSTCESIQSTMANPDLRLAAKSHTSFALELFKQVSNKSNANVFMSPFSISVAMAMTYLGARGNTQRQMKDALGFKDMDDEEMHAVNLRTHRFSEGHGWCIYSARWPIGCTETSLTSLMANIFDKARNTMEQNWSQLIFCKFNICFGATMVDW